MECSASDNNNIFRIFKTFLHLSKINLSSEGGNSNGSGGSVACSNNNRLSALKQGSRDDMGLRRNLSAYGRLRSPTTTPTKTAATAVAAAAAAAGAAGEEAAEAVPEHRKVQATLPDHY